MSHRGVVVRNVVALSIALGIGFVGGYLVKDRTAAAGGGETDLESVTGITMLEKTPDGRVYTHRFDVKRITAESRTIREEDGWDDPDAVRFGLAGRGVPVQVWATPAPKHTDTD